MLGQRMGQKLVHNNGDQSALKCTLHSQNTAALQLINFSGQTILQKLTRKDIFVKQVDINICL